MKKLDLVKLVNERPYIDNGLKKDMHGIIVTLNIDNADTLFFNPKNVGDYAIVNVKLCDMILDTDNLPKETKEELSQNRDMLVSNAKTHLEPITINEYDMVELLVEDDNYAKFDVHKGDRGCVTSDNAVQNYILVDFSGIDKNGKFYGDCISVKIEDLKVIE